MAQKVINDYEFRQDFKAPRANLQEGEALTYMAYPAGAHVRGYLLESNIGQPLPPDVQVIITEDEKYAIPAWAVNQIDTAAAAEKKEMSLPREIQERLNAIKSSDIVGNVLKTSQGLTSGLGTGAVIGLLYAVVARKNVWLCATVSAVAGAVIGYLISKNAIAQKAKINAAPAANDKEK